ncbi:hypothetical protein ACXWRW_10995, partial [Streptococcus pyogenes]
LSARMEPRRFASPFAPCSSLPPPFSSLPLSLPLSPLFLFPPSLSSFFLSPPSFPPLLFSSSFPLLSLSSFFSFLPFPPPSL